MLFEVPPFEDINIAEVFALYKNNRICKNGVTKPYIFDDRNLYSHTPIIKYESTDYLHKFSNWSIYDKLLIEKNFLRYSYAEFYEGKTVFITGSLLLGSIYSLLIMINRALSAEIKKNKLKIKLTINSNEKMTFRIQDKLMALELNRLEMYYLNSKEKNEISYTFGEINNAEINKFTNRFLGLFTSENPKSRTPFASVDLNESSKFYQLLLQYDYYLAIDN